MTNILDTYINQLLKAGINNAKNEINWFVEQTFNFRKENIFLKKINLSDNQLKKIKIFVKRRIQKEPFQHIVNRAPFFGIDFYVNEHVLIPRPETETIINILINNKKTFNKALDLCTGSGNLALLLSLKGLSKHITAIDNSTKALEVSKKNFKQYNVKNIDCIHLDFLNNKINNKFDLIVCNPPYISKNEYKNLTFEVKKFEPKAALTDNSDGLTFYKKICKELNYIMKDNGVLLLEIGLEKHKHLIEKIFINKKYKWHKDLNNNHRIIQVFK